MKSIFKKVGILITSILLVAGFTGCANGSSANNTKPEAGYEIKIVLPGNENRAAFYEQKDAASYTVTVTKDSVQIGKKTGTPGSTITFTVPDEGTYDVNVKAFNKDGVLIGEGNAQKSVLGDGKDNIVKVTITPKEKDLDLGIEIEWGSGNVSESTGYLEGAGEVVSAGIKIGETTFEKTSEVVIVPAGKKAIIDMKDDSSWNTYVVDSAPSYMKGVFVKDCKVTLNPFVMSQYEVTQELYSAVSVLMIGNSRINPSTCKSDADEGEIQKLRPVESVSYDLAVVFCNTLTKKTMTNEDVVYYSDEAKTTAYTYDDYKSSKTPYMDITKKGYRLPTEAEWEYAARGGNPKSAEWKNAFGTVNTKDGKMIYDGENYLYEDDNMATVGWYKYNSNDKSHEVGLKDKNSLNLYDMLGNVSEMCWDRYTDGVMPDPYGGNSDNWTVCRGGSYYVQGVACRSVVSMRYSAAINSYDQWRGFRVCRSID